MGDGNDFNALVDYAERVVDVDETQTEISERAQSSAERGNYDGFSAGSAGRDPGQLPDRETAQRYVDLEIPLGPANYHEFVFGEKDIDRYWNALSAIDENALSTHAGFWRHAAQLLSHYSGVLFNRKAVVEETFRGDAADMFYERVGAARFSMDEWWSAAGWVATELELLAATVPSRKQRLFPIWRHYRWMLAYLHNWPEGRPIVVYDPSSPGWSPDWPVAVIPVEEDGSEITDATWTEYYSAYDGVDGFRAIPGQDSAFEKAELVTGLYHERAADVIVPLAENMVDTHMEIYTRMPVQFYGHTEPGHVPRDLLMPDVPMPGLTAPDVSGVDVPSMPGISGGGVPGSVLANLPVMPAGVPGMAGYDPATSPFAEQLARLRGPGDLAGQSAGLPDLPDNGELALMPDATLPGVSSGGFPSGLGTGAGPGAGAGLPPLLGGGPVPGLAGAGPRGGGGGGGGGGFRPDGVPGSNGVPGATGLPGGANLPGLDGVPGVGGGVPGVDAIPGTSGVPNGGGVASVDGVPGVNGVPSANGVAGTGAAPAALSGAASGSLAGTPHGGMGMLPPPMMPPMVPPMAGGQQARQAGQGGQGGEGGAAAPPGMPGMFVPPGTVSQRGTSPTAPQPRPATLPGAARTAARRAGLGRLGGLAQTGRPAAQQPAAPAAPDRASDQTAAGDQEMWRVKKTKGSLPGPTPQQPASRHKPAGAAG